MGTNYYLTHKRCDHCGRSESLHICKSLSIFRGHFTYDETGEDSPAIVSWAQWKDVLQNDDCSVITDEYGDVHSVADFIRWVEDVPMEARRRQTDWMVEHGYGPPAVEPGGHWYCPDGFSFSGNEFS